MINQKRILIAINEIMRTMKDKGIYKFLILIVITLSLFGFNFFENQSDTEKIIGNWISTETPEWKLEF